MLPSTSLDGMLNHLKVGTKHTGRAFGEALQQEQDGDDLYMVVVHVKKCVCLILLIPTLTAKYGALRAEI